MAGATPQQSQQPNPPNQFEELKDIVTATLEKQGILAKAQAQLRKHVFEALSLTEQENKKFENVSPKIDENNVHDRYAMALIRDFLSYHHLDYTLSLMNTESRKKLEKTQDITRNEIASRLGLPAQKPNPDCSLLRILVEKLFDNDVLKPRNSILTQDIKLKPRASNDSYRSTLDSSTISVNTIEFKQTQQIPSNAESNDNQDRNVDIIEKYTTNPLENLDSFKLPLSNNLPPITTTKKASIDHDEIGGDKTKDIKVDQVEINVIEEDTVEEDIVEEDIVEDESVANDNVDDDHDDDDKQEMQDTEQGKEEENQEEENQDEELKKIEQMNKAMEELRQQTSEFEKLKKESVSPSITEYDDEDFGSDDINSNIDTNSNVNNKDDDNNNNDNDNNDNDDMSIEIEEDIEIDLESLGISLDETTDNIYSAKDDQLAKDVKLENVADIIMNVKTQQIDYKL